MATDRLIKKFYLYLPYYNDLVNEGKVSAVIFLSLLDLEYVKIKSKMFEGKTLQVVGVFAH